MTIRCIVCLIVYIDAIINKWLPVRRMCERMIHKVCIEVIKFLPEHKPAPRKLKKEHIRNKLLVSLPVHEYLCY